MKIEKTNLGYKLYTNFFWKKNYLQTITSKRTQLTEDLIFESLSHAQLYLDYFLPYQRDKLKDLRLFAVKNQLQKVLQEACIDPKEFSWADLWCGNGIWGSALKELTQTKITLIDINPCSYEDPFWDSQDPLIDFQQLDTSAVPLPAHVTAIFLRSGVGPNSIQQILSLNPHIKLVLIIPEGLGSNEFLPFTHELDSMNSFFNITEKKDLKSDFGVKGSNSSFITSNQYFPLLIGKDRR